MYKPNNKKMLTVLIAVAMIFSAFAILSFAATPAYAQSATGTFYATTDPVSSPTTSGGTIITPLASPAPMIFLGHDNEVFTAGQTVDFYWSTTTAATGIVSGIVGSTTSTSSGAISGVVILTSVPSTPGSYYLVAASEGSTSGGIAASSAPFTITSQTNYPISLSLSLDQVSYAGNVTTTYSTSGTTVYFEGSGFASTGSSSVVLSGWTLSGASPATSFSITAATPSSGKISGSFTVPEDPAGYYYIIAYDSGTGAKATGQAVLGITESVSPILSIPAKSTTVTTTLNGYGFPTSATFSTSTTTAPSDTLTIGGVDAILGSAPTVATTGSVTFSIIGLASQIATTGPQTVVITDQQGASFTFSDQAYVSSPTAVPVMTVTDASTSSTSGNVGDTLQIVVINMLASSTITFMLGGQTLTTAPSTATTDANGFVSVTSTVPAIPGGSYTLLGQIASSSTVVEYVSTSFTVLPSITFGTSAVTGEYLPTGSTITVVGSGLSPNAEYAITDTGFVSAGGTGNVVYDLSANGALSGTETITYTTGSAATDNMGVMSTSSGEIQISYGAEYSGLATGSNETISVTGPAVTATTTYYYAIGAATVTVGSFSYNPSGTTMVSVQVSGLIPSGASLPTGASPETYKYNLYVGSTAEPVYVNGATTATAASSYFSTSTGSVSLTFSPSDLSDGSNTISIDYTQLAPSSTNTVGSVTVLGSTPSSSAGDVFAPSGTSNNPGLSVTYYLYDFPASSTVTYSYYTTTGKQTSTIVTDANGAANLSFTVPMAPAGTYQLSFSVVVSGNTLSVSPAPSFTVLATLSSVPSSSSSYPNTGSTTTTPVKLYSNTNVTLYAYGLSPESYYAVYAGSSKTTASGTALGYFTTDISGSYSSGVTVTVPGTLTAGTNYLVVAPAGSTTVAAYYDFTFGANYNIFGVNFNYTTNTEYAFPGEILPISYTTTLSGTPIAGTLEAVILLNGTAYATVPATYDSLTNTFTAYFTMYNGQPGTNYTFQVVPEYYTTLTTALTYDTAAESAKPTISLVNGTGALVVSLSTAQLTAIIQTSIGNAMKVPLSELNASVTSIKGLTANITTAFGKMTTTLSAINATVASVESGQVLVQTDLGSIKTSLASLNASIVAFNGNVATISTTLGQVQTSLSSIGTQVTTNGNGIATIKTDLGTLSGTVTSTNGTVSSISTSLGNLNATVQKINSNTQGFGTLEVFLIVIVVLVLITLVLSFMAVSAANKASRKVSEEKKQ